MRGFAFLVTGANTCGWRWRDCAESLLQRAWFSGHEYGLNPHFAQRGEGKRPHARATRTGPGLSQQFSLTPQPAREEARTYASVEKVRKFPQNLIGSLRIFLSGYLDRVKKGGERGRNRTFNLLIKSQLLCQLSYAPGDENRHLSQERADDCCCFSPVIRRECAATARLPLCSCILHSLGSGMQPVSRIVTFLSDQPCNRGCIYAS
jgi:hypothetical protein